MTLSTLTLNIHTLMKIALIVTLSINDTQHNDTQQTHTHQNSLNCDTQHYGILLAAMRRLFHFFN